MIKGPFNYAMAKSSSHLIAKEAVAQRFSMKKVFLRPRNTNTFFRNILEI